MQPQPSNGSSIKIASQPAAPATPISKAHSIAYSGISAATKNKRLNKIDPSWLA